MEFRYGPRNSLKLPITALNNRIKENSNVIESSFVVKKKETTFYHRAVQISGTIKFTLKVQNMKQKQRTVRLSRSCEILKKNKNYETIVDYKSLNKKNRIFKTFPTRIKLYNKNNRVENNNKQSLSR